MEFFQLKQFVAIAQSKTMREAAEKLFLSQPALSQNLKRLENELGCKLFDRSHNQLQITPYGEILLERAYRIMFDLQEAHDEISALKARETMTLRIGFFSKPACVFLAPQIATALPDLRFEASLAQGGEGAAKLLNGDIDLIVIPEGKCPEGLESMTLFIERAALSVPIDYPLEIGDEVSFAEIARMQIMIPDGFGGLTGWYESLLELSGIEPCNVIRLEERGYLATMDASDRVHLTTSFLADFMGEIPSRKTIPFADERASRPIALAWRSGDEKVRKVVDFAQAGGIRTAGGHSFLPYILYPGNASNLEMIYD